MLIEVRSTIYHILQFSYDCTFVVVLITFLHREGLRCLRPQHVCMIFYFISFADLI